MPSGSACPRLHTLISRFASVLFIGTLMLGGLFLGTPTASASSTSYSGVSKGALSVAGTVDLRRLPPGKASQPAAHRHSRGVRRVPHRGSPIQVTRPAATSSFVDAAHTGALLSNFNGVSSLDSAVTNFGAEFEPPDQGLCVGNGFVLEAVNSAFTIYHTDGSVVMGPFNVNVLFNEGLTEFTSDPRCYYDKSTNTWFAIILFINSTNTEARTDLAVNTSGDPTTSWTEYRLDATDDGSNGTPSHPGCPCFGDQPLLGIDQQNIYISTNEFSILGPQFNGAQIYPISKSDLVALSSTIHFVHFENLSIGGTIAASVQPAITNGKADAEYFLNSLDPFGTFDNRLGVWALTNQAAVSHGGIPNLSSVVITSEPYGVPPGAIQQGADSLLNADDDRMQQVQFINGDLWGALDTAVTIPNDTALRAGLAWFEVHPHLNGAVIGGAQLKRQGYVTSLGNYLLYPAIQVDRRGTAAMVMTLSGPTFFPSAAYTVLAADHKSFGTIHVAAPGTGPYDPTATRWGDYSWAVLDPNHNNIWMATEYIPPLSSQTPDGLRNWGTRVFEVAAN
jgi:hypothetical protein